MKKIDLRIWPETEKIVTVDKGSRLIDLVPKNTRFPALVAFYRNQLCDLQTQITEPGTVRFLDITTKEGMEAYRKSANFILCRAFLDVYRNGRIAIWHSLGNNYFYEIFVEIPVDNEVIDNLKNRMQEIIEDDESFLRISMPSSEAKNLFKDNGFNDKVRLLSTKPEGEVKLYTCANFCDFDLGPLVPSTGYIKTFDIKRYEDGLLLSFPDPAAPEQIAPLKHYRKLFQIYKESREWGRILKVNDVGRLNEFVNDSRIYQCMKAMEVLHEKKIAKIADIITERKDSIRVILIAGPSAAGKTTFSKRLSVHLYVNGIKSVPIAMDNYFLERSRTPRDENGDYDFESIYALDLELFNQHLAKLINGEEVFIPRFDFETGSRKPESDRLRIAENQMIIIEGIHGLNDMLTESVPHENKFKIYISALTQISIDDFNRIHTNDVRLIRRMVRDQQFRGYSAVETLKRWASVRRGEEKNIFPFQENADVMFNSALIYGLAVLKKYAFELLTEVKEDCDVYPEAKRLLDFLEKFNEIEHEEEIPPTSIIREYIGGSTFDY